MDEAEKWAKTKGYGEMLLYTNTVRIDAHRFYQRIGYVADDTSYVFHKRL